MNFCRFALSLALANLVFGVCCQPQRDSDEAERIFVDSPPTWVTPLPEVRISPDERWAVFGSGAWLRVVSLETGLADDEQFRRNLDDVSHIVFTADGTIARRGSRAGRDGWFLDDRLVTEIPSDATARWSPDGRVAFYRTGSPRAVTVDATEYPLDGSVRALEWDRDGSAVLVLVTDDGGDSSMVSVRPAEGRVETLVRDLDAPLRGNTIGVGDDGVTLYLALAGAGPLPHDDRHAPDADRDLDVYAVETFTGTRTPVVASPMDELSPQATAEHLYWTRVDYRQSIVTLPLSGGEPHLVAEGGQIPYWSHDGRAIGYTTGLPLAADAPLNMDADAVDVDENARPVSAPRRIIHGYHEDFTPSWSPDGAWLAFHSHRSPTPVPAYGSEGSTDDLYLLPNGAPTEDEIRLTDFGWEVGMADWASDGERLVFVTWEAGAPGIGIPYVVTIDPTTGKARNVHRLGLPQTLRSARLVAWSPRADAIAIENDDGNGRQSIWVMNLQTGDVDFVVDYESDTYSGLDWTPDGETLVYSALVENSYQIFSVPRSGGEPSKLSHDSGLLLQPQVSPDGRFIAATRIEATRELWRRKR